MRKRIIIGDMHGRYDIVKKIYDFENPDDVIMLGDYVDSHEIISDEQQHDALNNLAVLQSKHKNGKFILLMGNHDFHYFYNNIYEEQYSGYSYDRATWAPDFFQQMIRFNKMQMVYIDNINKTIYSHAGISKVWLENHDLSINEINSEIINNPQVFKFTYGSGFSATGDCPENSPIWIRPYSLLKNMYNDIDGIWTQIVGHTPCKKHIGCMTVDLKQSDISDANLILCDNLPNEYIVEYINDDGTLYSREIENTHCL